MSGCKGQLYLSERKEMKQEMIQTAVSLNHVCVMICLRPQWHDNRLLMLSRESTA